MNRNISNPNLQSLSPDKATVLGWGVRTPDSSQLSHSLRKLNVFTTTNSQCFEYFDNNVLSEWTNFCAGTAAKIGGGVCRGDGGGPLVATKKDGMTVLYGIISGVTKCGKFPGEFSLKFQFY